MNIALFSEQEIKNPLSLKDERAEHIIKILHKRVGDTFSCGIINQKAGSAKITEITQTHIKFDFTPLSDGKLLFPLKMIIGFPRPIQLKRLLRDIAALGICQVHLTGTELGEKSYMQSNLVEHGTAYKMLLDGTVQAASTHVPNLFLHKTLPECLKSFENENQIKIALDNVNPQKSLSSYMEQIKNLPKETQIIAAIGSERGWTDKERKFLEDSRFIRLGMGQRVMRTETAATVASSIILSSRGFLD